MELVHQSDELGGEFRLFDGANLLAKMIYRQPFPDRIVVNHTQVDRLQSGKGLGRQLFDAMVSYTRKEQLSVVPACQFTRKMFAKCPEYQDLL